MSSVPSDDDEKLGPGRIAATIILALLALVCFGACGMYLLSPDHHSVRVIGSFVLGVAFVIGAWFALRYQSLAAEEARETERNAAAQAVASATVTSATDAAVDEAIEAATESATDAPAEVAAEAVAEVAAEAAAGPGQQATAATQA